MTQTRQVALMRATTSVDTVPDDTDAASDDSDVDTGSLQQLGSLRLFDFIRSWFVILGKGNVFEELLTEGRNDSKVADLSVPLDVAPAQRFQSAPDDLIAVWILHKAWSDNKISGTYSPSGEFKKSVWGKGPEWQESTLRRLLLDVMPTKRSPTYEKHKEWLTNTKAHFNMRPVSSVDLRYITGVPCETVLRRHRLATGCQTA